MATPAPGPELTPVTYWPARQAGEPDLGLFSTSRQQLLLAGWSALLTGMTMGTFAVTVDGGTEWILVALALFSLLLSMVCLVAWGRRRVPPSGVWQVDERGYPTEYVGQRRDPHLRKDRGVTREAFLESVRLRAGSAG